MVRLVLFDIDSTLICTGGAGQKAFAHVCESHFNVPDGVAGLNFAGRTDPSIVRDFFLKHHIEPSAGNFQRFFAAYVLVLGQLLTQSEGRVLPGVREFLERLRALQPAPALGLLTGNIRRGAEIKLRYFGLWDDFVVGAFGDDHEDRCEVASIARQRGSQLLSHPLVDGEVLVVGDTPLDIACARSIHAGVLAVATGNFTVAELQRHQPEWAVATLSEVAVEKIC